MRILLVNVNTTSTMTSAITSVARRYARPGTNIVGIQPTWGPESVEGFMEGVLSAAAVIERLATFRDSFDAVVLAGYGESGREAVRELVDVPVLDVADSAAVFACQLGRRFSVVTTFDRSVPQIEESLRNAGLDGRCASVRATGLGVLEQDEERTRRRLLEEARRAIDDDGAEVICLGCGGMAGFDKELERELGVPVIDGVVAAVKLAESFYDYGLKTSKVTAFAARRERIRNWPRPADPAEDALRRGHSDALLGHVPSVERTIEMSGTR